MRRGGAKGPWILLLFLLAGVIIGSVIGNIIADYSNAGIFQESFVIGTQGAPAVIDLTVVKLAFGLTFTVNFGTVLGLLLGIFFYYKA